MKPTKMWERTNDVVGHRRNFKHICSSCGNNNELFIFTTEDGVIQELILDNYKFIFRHSNAIPYIEHKIPNKNKCIVEEPCNIMSFKCGRCSLMDRFIIDDTKEYIDKILKLRDGVTLYVPPFKEWEDENEEIKQRLKDLGYI